MGGLYKCSTCHWHNRDGSCSSNRSPHGLNRDYMSDNDSCSSYEMNYELKRDIERQEERKERERKEREHQEWLASEEGQKWQAEQKRKEEKERKERERKEREHQEWLASEEGQQWQAEQKRKEEEEETRKNKNKNISKIGIFLLFGATAAYLFILWRTDMIKSLWLSGEFSRLLPLVAFSLAVGVLSAVFKKYSDSGNDYGSGSFAILAGMVIVQAITASFWTGNVGILFIKLIGRGILNILSVIPGAILLFKYTEA